MKTEVDFLTFELIAMAVVVAIVVTSHWLYQFCGPAGYQVNTHSFKSNEHVNEQVIDGII